MQPANLLTYYGYAFANLKRDKSKGDAPHKPVLLLSVLHEYAAGRITGHQIDITPELTHTFARYWNALVTSGHTMGFALPFYSLSNEKGGWWRLQPMPGCEDWLANASSMRTFANLTAAVAYASLEEGLAGLLLQPATRQELRHLLLTTYFPGQTAPVVADDSASYVRQLGAEVANESQADYREAIAKLQADLKTKRMDPETYQIEVYNRGAVFRREIIRLYDETCCVSGLRVAATFSLTMVDACHIKPFAVSFDNTLTNGIALCPNLHRAFDRGLLSVNDHYEVIFSAAFTENAGSAFRLRLMDGVRLALPADTRHWPSLEAFAWHRENAFQRNRALPSNY